MVVRGCNTAETLVFKCVANTFNKGCNSMVVSGLRFENTLVGTG